MTDRTVELRPHPAHAGTAVRRIDGTVAFAATRAELHVLFRVQGDIGRLRLPALAAALRADGLWQHTCFETFLRPDEDEAYYELNFSPGGAWAAYRFSGRRSGRESPPMPAPRLEFRRSDGSCEMSAVISIDALPALARSNTIHAGLAMVIEEDDGRLCYWALAHRAPQPDFHDPATFTLVVPSA